MMALTIAIFVSVGRTSDLGNTEISVLAARNILMSDASLIPADVAIVVHESDVIPLRYDVFIY